MSPCCSAALNALFSKKACKALFDSGRWRPRGGAASNLISTAPLLLVHRVQPGLSQVVMLLWSCGTVTAPGRRRVIGPFFQRSLLLSRVRGTVVDAGNATSGCQTRGSKTASTMWGGMPISAMQVATELPNVVDSPMADPQPRVNWPLELCAARDRRSTPSVVKTRSQPAHRCPSTYPAPSAAAEQCGPGGFGPLGEEGSTSAKIFRQLADPYPGNFFQPTAVSSSSRAMMSPNGKPLRRCKLPKATTISEASRTRSRDAGATGFLSPRQWDWP